MYEIRGSVVSLLSRICRRLKKKVQQNSHFSCGEYVDGRPSKGKNADNRNALASIVIFCVEKNLRLASCCVRCSLFAVLSFAFYFYADCCLLLAPLLCADRGRLLKLRIL